MTIMKKFSAILWLVLIVHLGHPRGAIWAASFSQLKLDESLVSWSDLSFQAKDFFATVKVDVQLNPYSAAHTDMLLNGNIKRELLRPPSSQIYHITVNTAIDPLFRSTVALTNLVLFNPREATAIHRIRLRRGKDDFKKTYRFTRKGVHRLRREPTNPKEALLAPEKWNNVKETFYPYNLAQLGYPDVSDPSVLIYIVSAVALAPDNKPLSLCIFGKQQLHHVRLLAKGLQPLKIDYLDRTEQRTLRKEGMVEAQRIVLEAQSMNTDQEEVESFSFLGLKKDIVIYVDSTSRIPIQVSGIIPEVGEVKLKLREVRLRQETD